MRIPKNLPQFEKSPALFITSGEYEAKFFVALEGNLELKKEIKMPPRTEAREKQGFIGRKSGKQALASVSHKGRYIEDLKMKFKRQFHAELHDLLAEYKRNCVREIYVFAPDYVAARVTKALDKEERKKIRMEFFQEDTKINPLAMVKKFWLEEQRAVTPKAPAKDSVRKILDRPRVR